MQSPYSPNLDYLEYSVSYPELANSKDESLVDVNCPILQTFNDTAFGNDLIIRRSTTGMVFIYCGSAIIIYH